MSDISKSVLGFIATSLVMVFGFALGLVTMMYGWGLEPKSWGVIIACAICGQLLVATLHAITAAMKE